MKRVLEICVDSLESALIAQEAGADRIELCSCLEVGGLTPDAALFSLAREKLSIPIHVLIRPRLGNFVYTAVEQTVILRSIEYCRQHGADAVVIGALSPKNELDQDFLLEMREVASSMSITFHRAFDVVENPLKALKQLNELDMARVLTSGQKSAAIDGIPLLKRLKEQPSNVKILAGGGVISQNVTQLLDAGIAEVHASARQPVSQTTTTSKIAFSKLKPDEYRLASFQEIVNLRNQLNNHQPYV
ncbi:copper homeostasis protein CutC [Tunicatimonas pelagia]|uniref:copper homeostasis protein CutC n=1 Tax=Tunicatimonas pelagia TaxID=931531 RepID=UPI00266609CD|nr:copper homeostasis protein CutC [Tunicatimonas pelagia]WKN43369.1 copper homeostasis protein CutC [Tunicatimonas pelagia]